VIVFDNATGIGRRVAGGVVKPVFCQVNFPVFTKFFFLFLPSKI